MQLLDLQQRRDEQELQQMQEDLGRSNNNNNNAGNQSEPTTPPEYRESSSGFPSAFSRPNRYSTSSITSPPGLYNRPGRSGSQLTSPQAGIMQSRLIIDDKLPSKSVPGSRRNSDEDEKEEAVRQDPTSHRSTNAYVYKIPLHSNMHNFFLHTAIKHLLPKVCIYHKAFSTKQNTKNPVYLTTCIQLTSTC